MNLSRLSLLIIGCICSCVMSHAREAISDYGVRDGLSATVVGGAVQDARGLMWLATWNGLDCYDGYEFHHVRIRPGDNAPIGTNHIRDIQMSADGNIVCHTDDDIFLFDLTTYSFRDLSDERKSALADSVGKTWSGTTDRQGSRWTAGPVGLRKTYTKHHPAALLDGTAGEHPGAMMLDGDSLLWVSTRRTPGLNVYDMQGNLRRRLPMPSVAYSMCRTSSGDVWVGCKPGALFRLGETSISDVPVYDMCEDAQGRLWIATFGEGVKCCMDPHGQTPKLSATLGGRKVRKLLITRSGNLVAATTEGLLTGRIPDGDCHDIVLRQVRRNGSDSGSLCSDATMCVAADSSGNVYVGTESSGVDVIIESSLFSDRPIFRHLDAGELSANGNVCRAMSLVDDSLLIIAGNDNVTAINVDTGEAVNFNRNFWADTCLFAEALPVVLPDGTWAVAAEQGVFMASRHNVNSRGYIPALVFTTMSIGSGQPKFGMSDRIELPADERNITIGFAAIDFVDNRGILYRTRLDGSPWTGGSRDRSVTLFNLAPGSHVLEVQSTDRYGRWVDNCRVITIDVPPFWYETWWARTVFVLLAVAIVFAIIRTHLYIKNISRQRRELLEKYMALLNDGKVSETESARTEELDDGARSSEDAVFLERVWRYVGENISNTEANVDDMASAAAVSRSTLNRRLRSALGISAAQLLIEARMRRAAELLVSRPSTGMSVADVAYECGYSDTAYFQRAFKKRYGVGANEYTG